MRLSVASSVWAVRVVGILGLLLGLLGGVPEGYTPPAAVVAVVLLGGVVAAFRPDDLVASLAMGVVVVFWAVQLDTQVPAGCLVAAAGLVTAHVAGTLLTYGPPFMAIPGDLVVLWLVRGFLVWLAAPAVWLVARVYADHAVPTSFWLAGLATALAGAVLAALVVRPTAESDR
jgi:hypothetical protein